MNNGFHDVEFPARLAIDMDVTVQARVDITQLASGHEHRNARWSRSKRRYTLAINQRPKGEVQAVLNFFEARSGPLYSFKLSDPFNNSTAEGDVVQATDVNLGIADGVKVRFQLMDNAGRDIFLPKLQTTKVAIDGLEQGEDFELDARGGLIFQSPPANGSVVTAGCEFFVPVRFENDSMTVTRTSYDAAQIPDVRLLEVDFS